MANTLPSALTALRNVINGVTGINAPNVLPDAIEVEDFPIAVVYPDVGEYTPGGYDKGLHTVVVDIHHSVYMSGAAIDTVAGYPEAIGDKLLDDPTLGGQIAGIVFPISYQTAELPYAGKRHFGIRLRLRVKTHR